MHRIAAIAALSVASLAHAQTDSYPLPGYSTTTWYGVLAPAGTRTVVLERVSAAAKRAVSAPDLRERLLTDGAEPEGSSPAAFQKHLASEMAKWRKVVKAAAITAE